MNKVLRNKYKLFFILVFIISFLYIFYFPNIALMPAFLERDGQEELELEDEEKIKILIVPGHDLFSAGTVYKDLREEVLTRELSAEIYELLESDERFIVYTTRDFKTGNYTDEFEKYFASAEVQILNFKNTTRRAFNNLLDTGLIEKVEPVVKHNKATEDVVFRLYGINKWANDNEVDLALHVHFNDVPRKDKSVVGKYKGFAIYVPDKQFDNASTSREIAEILYKNIDTVSAQSTFPLEEEGIIESQDLIATGSYNSQTHPAMVVEYGYIYEQKYALPKERYKSLPRLARATYEGLVEYFWE